MTKRITFTTSEYDILKAIMEERVNKLEKSMLRYYDRLDEYDRNINNYPSYSILQKLSKPEVILDTK
tara:strand:- start:1712 stop:1912 length:201 start_codon:yes stop_codon:yes gene_type:complete